MLIWFGEVDGKVLRVECFPVNVNILLVTGRDVFIVAREYFRIEKASFTGLDAGWLIRIGSP